MYDVKLNCKHADAVSVCIGRCPLPMILLAEEGCSTIVEVSDVRFLQTFNSVSVGEFVCP